MESNQSQDPESNLSGERMAPSHSNIKQAIGIMSSKGGVGKSFVTGLLACELARMGYQVGILDADLTGSTIPMYYGVNGPLKTGKYSFLPLETSSGIKIMSVNLLIEDEGHTVIWKEALAGKVIEELYKEVEWGTIDYLLIDLPPGNSEVGVSVLRSLPLTGVMIVTQPQESSARVASKAIRAAHEIGMDIIGVVENMSYALHPDTGEKMSIFGGSHVDELSEFAEAPVLTRIPYTVENNALCNSGRVEDISIPQTTELYESMINSLLNIQAKAASRKVVEPETESLDKPENTLNDVDISDYSDETTHTGEYFSDIVTQLIRNRHNIGILDHPDAEGYFLGSCGDRMQIHLQIVAGRILDAKFLADGCGATLACGSMITKMACSKTVEEAGKITPDELILALNGLPDDHLHCAELAVMTLREAAIDAIEGHGNK